MINTIINEEINKYLKSECMLKEYRNPKDSETVRVIGDNLEAIYNNILESGVSKHEVVVETMGKIIGELRRLEQMMNM